MKRILTLILVLALLIPSFTGCAKVSTKNKKYTIVTTVFAAYDFARQVAGDEAEVTLLLKPGMDSHSYEPTPADIIEISNCDMFIYTGGENDAWIDDILSSIDNDDMTLISMLDCVSNRYIEEEVEGMESEDEDESEWDEHVWMSPQNAIDIVGAIAEALILDGLDENTVAENRDNYANQIQSVDDYIQSIVDESEGRTLIFGDRFPIRYFTEEFGLDYYAAFSGCSENSEASAATVAFLIDKVKENNIPVVFKIELTSDNLANTIAAESGAEVETFYTCHNITQKQFDAGETYVSLMYHNAEVLKEALNYGSD